MKRYALVCIIAVVLLIGGVLSQRVYADDQPDFNTEDYLTEDEAAFVAGFRSAVIETRAAIELIRYQLKYPDLFNNKWQDDMDLNLTLAYHACRIPTSPDSMQEVNDMWNEEVVPLVQYLGYASGITTRIGATEFRKLMDVVKELEILNGQIEEIEGRIVFCEMALNERIAKLAEARAVEEEAEEWLEGGLFDFEDCFIATAVYGMPVAAEIDTLRCFRDEFLLQNPMGMTFVDLYYEFSPPLADFISEHEVLRTAVREGFVDPVVNVVDLTRSWWAE